jgi:SNF2-related domain
MEDRTVRKPYPHQEKEVEWFVQRTPRRGLVLSDAGLGKSVTSLLVQKELRARRHLVITPSGCGRLTDAWRQRFTDWGSREHSFAVIDEGPRANDSEPAKFRKAAKLTADCLIVTPDLLKHVPQLNWDMITIDEIHEYVSARSANAIAIKTMVQKNPQAAVLGLTATPLTANALHTWTVIDMVWPGAFGRARPTGEPPWGWQKLWGNAKIGYEGRVAYSGLREDKADEFKKLLARYSIRTLREDLGGVLPKVDIRTSTLSSGKSLLDGAVATLDVISKESKHVAAYCYNIEEAELLFSHLSRLPRYDRHDLKLITGVREALRTCPVFEGSTILVATIGAVGVGISLSHIAQYVVFQPIKTAHSLLQLDGRHVRLDRPGQPPAIGHLLFRPGVDDDVRATLRVRLDEFAGMMRTGDNVAGLRAAVSDGERSFEDKLAALGASWRGDMAEDDGEETEEF